MTGQWSLLSGPAGVSMAAVAGFELTLTPAQVGTYRLQFVAASGTLATTRTVVVDVQPPPNQAPVINCPAAISGRVGQDIAISCTARDDGLPAGSVLTTSWTVLSAPGAAGLSGANSLNARLAPAAAGTYRLRVSVSDGDRGTALELDIEVRPPPNQAPLVRCPALLEATLGQAVLLTCSASDDGLPAGAGLQSVWSVVSAPAAISLQNAGTLQTGWVPAALGTYRLKLSVSDGELASTADVQVVVQAPPNQAPVLTCPATLAGTVGQPVQLGCAVGDDGWPAGSILSAQWTVLSAPSAVALESPLSASTRFVPTMAGVYRLRLSVSDGALGSSAELQVTVAPPPNQPPRVSCPASVSGQTGQLLSVACTAQDDGLPAGSTLALRWTVVSAPSALALGSADSATLAVTPSAAGSYRLRLTANDGVAQAAADVALDIAAPPPVAPLLSCPTSLGGIAGQTVDLSCTGAAQGPAAGTPLSASWRWLSLPASVTSPPAISGADSLQARITPPQAGSYQLRLTVNDGVSTTSADITVAVSPPPNQAPVVSCPQTLALRTDQPLVLLCTASDDGLPAGSTFVLAWSQVSGPAALALTGAASLSPTASVSLPGTYRLRLTASDGELSSSADVVVTAVLPPNQAPVVTCPGVVIGLWQQEVQITCSARDDGQPAGALLRPAWVVAAAPAAPALSGADSFTVRFTPSLPGTYRLRLGVSDGALNGTADVEVQVGLPPNRAPSVSCPSELKQGVGQPVVMTCAATDDGLPLGASLTPSWQFVSGPAIPELIGNWTFSTRFTASVPGSYRWRLHVSDSELSSSVDIVVTVEPPPNQAPVLACPTAVTGVAGSLVLMACSVTDDGLPAGSTPSVDWFITAAQAGITLEGYGSLTARFVPPVAGIYRFRVRASDSALSSHVDIVVTVTPPPNAAPQVQCARTAAGIVGQPVSITCTASDDGQPAGAVLVPSWRVLASPAAVTLNGASSLGVNFTPSVAGTYALRLTVGDSALEGVADVTVNVTPPPNKAPQVNCPARVDTRIGDLTRVSCSAVDDGLPAGTNLSLSWSWVSAPASPVISADGANAGFTPNVAGTYRLRLTASDGLLNSSADVELVVASSGPLRLQALGASTTQGYGGQQSYRYRLWTKLVDWGANVDFVGSMTLTQGGTPSYPDYRGRSFDRDHEGHSGYTAGRLADGLPTWMTGYVPDVSIVHVATNDMLFGGGSAVSQALAGMTQLVQRLRERNPNVRIFVARILPVDPLHPGWYLTGDYSAVPGRIASFNSQLPAWAATLSSAQSPIVVVDQNSGFDARAQTIDGIHPNASGEELVAQRWFDAIRSLF